MQEFKQNHRLKSFAPANFSRCGNNKIVGTMLDTATSAATPSTATTASTRAQGLGIATGSRCTMTTARTNTIFIGKDDENLTKLTSMKTGSGFFVDSVPLLFQEIRSEPGDGLHELVGHWPFLGGGWWDQGKMRTGLVRDQSILGYRINANIGLPE